MGHRMPVKLDIFQRTTGGENPLIYRINTLSTEAPLERKFFMVFGIGLCFVVILWEIRIFAWLRRFGYSTKLRSYSGLNRFGIHCIDHGGPQKASDIPTKHDYGGSSKGLILFVQG